MASKVLVDGDWVEGGPLVDGDIPASIARISQSIQNGDTTHAPSGDAVFDALALAEVALAAVDAAHAGKAPPLAHALSPYQGAPMYAYGHSLVGSDTYNTPGGRAHEIAARMLGLSAVSTRGIGGSLMSDVAHRIISGWNYLVSGGPNDLAPHPPGTKAVVVVDGMANDIQTYGSNANGIAAFKLSLRAAILAARAATKIEHTGFSATSAWLGQSLPTFSGGTAIYSNDSSDFIEFAVTVPASGRITLLSTILKQSTGPGGTFRVLDGTGGAGPVIATGTCDGATEGLPSTAARGYSPLPIALTGLTPGAHTIRLEATSGNLVYFDCVLVDSDTPPLVVVAIDPLLNWAGVGTDAAHALYKTAALAVVAEFPAGQVISADLGVGFDRSTMVGVDGVHPKDVGCQKMAENLAAAIYAVTPPWAGTAASSVAQPIGVPSSLYLPLVIRGRKLTAGAPASGTHDVQDVIVDSAGTWWVCTVAGTPGTWVATGPGGVDLPVADGGTGASTAATALANLGGVAKATFPVVIGVALSDETTAITTGNAKTTIRAPFAFTLTGVRATLTTASSSGIPTVDINEGGATILSTKLTIDANELTSTTAAAAAVISDATIADDAELTFDIDVAGTGAKGLKVWLIGTRVAP